MSAQCDATCTSDCGRCKGAGPSTTHQADVRRVANVLRRSHLTNLSVPASVLLARVALDAVAPAIAARVWDEAAEAVADWMSNNPSPSGIPHDPPRNPYADEIERTP